MKSPTGKTIVLVSAITFFIIAILSTIFVTIALIQTGTAQSCNYKGVTYKNDENFKEDCNSCSCQDGTVVCTEIACEDDYTPLGDEDEEQTDSCLYEGNVYRNGEGFTDVDGCNSCSCENGSVQCTTIACEGN